MDVSSRPHPYDALSWNAAPEERRAAIAALLSRPDEIDFAWLIQFQGRKDLWDGAATVLGALPPARLVPHLHVLLTWLQDLNWPGARDVFSTLAKIDPAWIDPALQVAARQAKGEGDDEWSANLARLAQDLRNRS